MSRTGKTPVYNHVWYQQNQAKSVFGQVKAQKFSRCLHKHRIKERYVYTHDYGNMSFRTDDVAPMLVMMSLL